MTEAVSLDGPRPISASAGKKALKAAALMSIGIVGAWTGFFAPVLAEF